MTYIKQVWEFNFNHSYKPYYGLFKIEKSRIGRGLHIYIFRHWFYIGWWPTSKGV